MTVNLAGAGPIPRQALPAHEILERHVSAGGIDIYYRECGEGDPILFLHGIPSNSWMWRNVLPQVANAARRRCIAPDLAGFGQSGLPPSGDYSIASQYAALAAFIEVLRLENIVLVVNDLGSLLGLKFAVEHPAKIAGIALLEAAFMPAEDWYRQLTFMQKLMFRMFRNPRRAEAWIVKRNLIPSMMMKMGVMRHLSTEELKPYLRPYELDIERRRLILAGPGPATFPPRGHSREEGDFAAELDAIAAGLIVLGSGLPFLLFEAYPGMITRAKAIEYARTHFARLTRVNIGKGRHFLAEDRPREVAEGLCQWLAKTGI